MAEQDRLLITSDNLLFDAGLRRTHQAFDKKMRAQEIRDAITEREPLNIADYYMVSDCFAGLFAFGTFVTEVTAPSLHAWYLDLRAKQLAGDLFGEDHTE